MIGTCRRRRSSRLIEDWLTVVVDGVIGQFRPRNWTLRHQAATFEAAALLHNSVLIPRDAQPVQLAVGPVAAGRSFPIGVEGDSLAVLPVVRTEVADEVAAVGQQQRSGSG